MMKILKYKGLNKIFIFVIFLVLILIALNFLLQPTWIDYNNYDTTNGFYEQPENTIENIFLGASIAVNGFTPMELYEDYGISSWNLSTELQPMLATYYWIREAYSYHSETLKTIVLDMSMLRTVPDEAAYKKALLGMKISLNKYQAIKDCTNEIDDFLGYLCPIFSYHTRWKELGKIDFGYKVSTCMRGYNYVTDRVVELYNYAGIGVPAYILNKEAGYSKFEEESLFYLYRIIKFCEEKEIDLLFVKTPGSSNWSDEDHNATQAIANQFNIDFIDFNYSPYVEEISYCEALDSVDTGHMNYYGATKLTSWIGKYLKENYKLTDVRDNPRYAFMKEELDQYHRKIFSSELSKIADPCEYIKKINAMGDYTIFLSVKDEGSTSLTEEQRQNFKNLGLVKLSDLQLRDSYLAVIDNGDIVFEESEHYEEYQDVVDNFDVNNKELLLVERSVNEKLELPIKEKEDKENYLEYIGKTKDGKNYLLISGGFNMGNISSCTINDIEYSPNERGINIVVYDNEQEKVIDAVTFDTYAESTRDTLDLEEFYQESDKSNINPEELPELSRQVYLYNIRCSDSYKIKALRENLNESGLYLYLNELIEDENYIIFLSVKDEAANSLDEKARESFAALGLTELSQLEFRDSYVGIIDGGEILVEKRSHEEGALRTEYFEYGVVSGGADSEDISSIMIDGIEYSLNSRGMNIVVYNKVTKMIVDTITFDTYSYPVSIN